MIQKVAGSSPAPSSKLYVVGRSDLRCGLRTAQIGHALVSWVLRWGQPPDNLVVLEVPGIQELEALLGPEAVGFYEPDLDGELTAVALCPRDPAGLSHLSLMKCRQRSNP